MAKMMRCNIHVAVDDDFEIGDCNNCPFGSMMDDFNVCSIGCGYDECPLEEEM